MRNVRLLLTAVAAVFVLTGCSFQRAWKAGANDTTPANEITGRWQGTWKSDSNGHTDKLRCLVTKKDESHYDARFHAKYRKVITFSFGYTVPLVVTNTGTQREFSGTANLGKLAGGIYTYKGAATATEFNARYDSKYDRGTFQMSRP